MYLLYLQKLKLCDKIVKKCELCTKVGEIMKLKQKIFCIATVIVLLFSLTACGKTKTKWSVESVNIEKVLTVGTVYRYKVKKVELIADSSVGKNNLTKDEVVETSSALKYFYSNSKIQQYTYNYQNIYSSQSNVADSQSNVAGGNKPTFAELFSDVEYKVVKEVSDSYYGSSQKTYYYQAYSKNASKFVKLRVVLGDLDKAFRPELEEKKGITTLKYYSYDVSNAVKFSNTEYDKQYFAKNEYMAVERDADYETLNKTVYAVGSDNSKESDEVKRLKEKYDGAAIISENKMSFNSDVTPYYIQYSSEKK